MCFKRFFSVQINSCLRLFGMHRPCLIQERVCGWNSAFLTSSQVMPDARATSPPLPLSRSLSGWDRCSSGVKQQRAYFFEMSIYAAETSLTWVSSGTLTMWTRRLTARLPPSSGHNHLSKASRGGDAWINEILKGDKTGWLLLKHSYGKCDDLIKIGIWKDVSMYHP